MSTALATETRYTPADLLAMPDGKNHELVDGRIVERRSGARSSQVGGGLMSRLGWYCEERGLGWIFSPSCGYQCFPHDPDRVRRPNVSFVRQGRFSGGRLPEGFVPFAPDLAVLVVAPDDLVYELDERLGDYRKAGVPLVWVINPRSRTAMVYRSGGTISRLPEDDELSGEEVIPGFRCPLREILPPPQPSEPDPSELDAPNGPT
jgi:Uma2 family endonuclease